MRGSVATPCRRALAALAVHLKSCTCSSAVKESTVHTGENSGTHTRCCGDSPAAAAAAAAADAAAAAVQHGDRAWAAAHRKGVADRVSARASCGVAALLQVVPGRPSVVTAPLRRFCRCPRPNGIAAIKIRTSIAIDYLCAAGEEPSAGASGPQRCGGRACREPETGSGAERTAQEQRAQQQQREMATQRAARSSAPPPPL